MESQKPTGDSRDRVLLVVDMRHESAQLAVYKICKILVPDAGHGIADNFHNHIRKLQAKENTVKERERRAERVTDYRNGGRAMR